ncbi:hypothetical protein DE146DRAFT_636937 [Phaeosphaeria sp. MPI-PUGE-AT-0046c]|nr:hypothetical protein DE146DRAFT_636937 [Phaeosphaeria sp. MPI-PUGE-AT-0046c]
MPCSQHNHKPWPTNGVHILRIEACERECGWCNAKSTSATNLRSHARKHLNNANATPLHNITIFSGKAGRKRVELATQLLAEQQQNDKLDSSVEKLDSNTDVCPSSNERVSTTTRVQDGHNDTFERSSQSLASMALNQDLNRVGKVGKDIDDASKHSSSAQIPDQYAPVAPITLDYAEQGHTLHSYQDVRSEIRELEKSIRRCSARLRAFVANLPPHFPTVHRYGVDSFITWCSLTSSSMLSLHEYFDERHIERPLVSAHESNLRKRSIGLAGTTMSHNEAQLSVPTSNIRVSTENYHCTPLKAIALASTPNYTTRAMMFQPSKGFSEETSQGRLDSSEQLKFTVHHEADLSRQQQLPSIGSLLSADQNDVASETLAESAPLVQLRYDSTARSINLTRTGRITANVDGPIQGSSTSDGTKKTIQAKTRSCATFLVVERFSIGLIFFSVTKNDTKNLKKSLLFSDVAHQPIKALAAIGSILGRQPTFSTSSRSQFTTYFQIHRIYTYLEIWIERIQWTLR